MAFIQLAFVYGYLASRGEASAEGFRRVVERPTPTVDLIILISIVPAHLLTLLLVWIVVTKRGKDSFRAAVGWSWNEASLWWSRARGIWTCVGITLSMLAFGLLLTNLISGEKTEMDRIVNSSNAARILIALIAAAGAPLVEELVYRGVLYSAFRKAIGAGGAIVAVSVLFAFIHVPQYSKNLAVVAAVSVLSIVLTTVRAWSGRLLPCFFIHLIFNGLQAIVLLLAPYLPVPVTDPSGAPKVTSTIVPLLTDWLKIF